MKSEKSYKKFQALYEVIFPLVGLTALYRWEGAVEIKVALTILLLRACYSWSEIAAIEKGFVNLFTQARVNSDSHNADLSAPEPEIYSWAEFIGLVLQMSATVIVSLAIAWGLGVR